MSAVPLSVFELSEKLERQIAAGDLNDALVLIQKTVERVIDEPLCTAEVFGSKFLDAFCQKIGALALAPRERAKPPQKTHVYLVTKLQKSGGHTRVLEDLIRAAPKDIAHVVLSTELVGVSDRVAIERNLQGHKVTFEWNADSLPLQKLLWLQNRMGDIAPESVWLFNHHQDSAIIAAVQPHQGYAVRFYHHGDHHLTLGLYLSFATHIDPLPMGFHQCRSRFGLSENVYLPLWMKDGGDDPPSRVFMKDGVITTCTAARWNKVEAPYFISYVSMIPEIISATGGRHIHIGKLTFWALWKIRRSLKARDIDAARFVYMPFTPGIWHALQSYSVDLLIASFPYGGARTLIEAMGAGTPVAVHDHYATRMLSCIDVVYPEAFVWRDPEDFYTFLKGLSRDFLVRQGRLARAFFVHNHNADLFQNLDLAKLPVIEPPRLRPHETDSLQWGLEVTRQISFFGLIWRFLYRHRRILKKFM